MKALDHLSVFLNRLSFAVKGIRFFAMVGGVALTGLGHYFRASSVAWQAGIADTLFWIGLVTLLLTNLLLVFVDKQSVEVLQSLHEEEKRNNELELILDDYEYETEALIAWNTLSRLLSELLDQALTNPVFDEHTRNRMFQAAVEFIADRKLRLFGVEDDYLNVSIYEHREADGELHCVACFRSRPSDAEGPHRTWGVGEGHVGKAFELQRELVCADARASDVAAWIAAPPDKHRDDDTERYISLIATPIAVEADKPLGVVIVTSDQPKRFVNTSDIETDSDAQRQRFAVESLQDFAAQLAQLMCILNSKPEKHVEEEAKDAGENG